MTTSPLWVPVIADPYEVVDINKAVAIKVKKDIDLETHEVCWLVVAEFIFENGGFNRTISAHPTQEIASHSLASLMRYMNKPQIEQDW